MDTEKSADRDAVKAKIEESQAAARELVKDATLLASQARVLRERAARTRAEAQRLRVQRAPAPGDTALLVTVSMACRLCGVCERTLRSALQEPDIQARVLSRNRRVGIFHRYTMLLPPDLVRDLAARFAARRERRPPP